MIETSFPVHQATNDVGSDDGPAAVVSFASAFGKGQAD